MRKQDDVHSDLLEIQARITAGDAVLDGDLVVRAERAASRYSRTAAGAAATARATGAWRALFAMPASARCCSTCLRGRKSRWTFLLAISALTSSC